MVKTWTASDLLNPTLQALHELGGSASNNEIHDKAVTILGLSDEQIALPHKTVQSSPTKIAYELTWARTWLKRYGLLENSRRGVWGLTAKGQATTESTQRHRLVCRQARLDLAFYPQRVDRIDSFNRGGRSEIG